MESQLVYRDHRTLFLTWVCGVALLCQEHDGEQLLFDMSAQPLPYGCPNRLTTSWYLLTAFLTW